MPRRVTKGERYVILGPSNVGPLAMSGLAFVCQALNKTPSEVVAELVRPYLDAQGERAAHVYESCQAEYVWATGQPIGEV